MIYFAKLSRDETIKIGCSICPGQRVRMLEYHYDQPIELLAVIDGGRGEEKAMHERFSKHRLWVKHRFNSWG